MESTIRALYNAACDHKGEEGCPVKVKMIEERHKAQTVYIGSRASDYFVRIYDKYEESGKEEYKNCVRVELEIKGRASKAIWERMCTSSDGVGHLVSHLKKIVSKRGIMLPDHFRGQLPQLVMREDKSREESQLAWLKRAVAPTVARISALRGWIQPFSMLFDEACTTLDKHAIVLAMVNVYGH